MNKHILTKIEQSVRLFELSLLSKYGFTVKIDYTVESGKKYHAQIDYIIECACVFFDLTLMNVKGGKSKRCNVKPREFVVGYLREHGMVNHPYQSIGYALNRDHSTIIHCYQKFKDNREVYSDYASQFDEFKDFVRKNVAHEVM